MYKEYQLRFATGFKLPTGVTENVGSRNIFLSPDMQNDTGTYDFISSASIIKNRITKTSFKAQLGIFYRIHTTNQNLGAIDGLGVEYFD